MEFNFFPFGRYFPAAIKRCYNSFKALFVSLLLRKRGGFSAKAGCCVIKTIEERDGFFLNQFGLQEIELVLQRALAKKACYILMKNNWIMQV